MKIAGYISMISMVSLLAACGGNDAEPAAPAKPAPSTQTEPTQTEPTPVAKTPDTTKKPAYPAPPSKGDPSKAAPTGRQCIIGMWASIHKRTEKTAAIELHYPRESWKDYSLSYYTWVYPIAITAASKAATDAIPDRDAKKVPEKGATIMRENKDSPWQVITDDSVCPGDVSKAKR